MVLLPWLLRRPRSAAFSWHGALTLFVYCAPFSFAYVELSAATGAMVLFAVVQASMLASSALAGQRVHAADIVGIAFALLGA